MISNMSLNCKCTYISCTTMFYYRLTEIHFYEIYFQHRFLLCSFSSADPYPDPYADLAAKFTDTIPEFHEHPDHAEVHTDAVPGPSNEKELESEKYKRDKSTEPSKLIYGQIIER